MAAPRLREAKACFGGTEPIPAHTLNLRPRRARRDHHSERPEIWISTAQVAAKILLLARTTPNEDSLIHAGA